MDYDKRKYIPGSINRLIAETLCEFKPFFIKVINCIVLVVYELGDYANNQ